MNIFNKKFIGDLRRFLGVKEKVLSASQVYDLFKMKIEHKGIRGKIKISIDGLRINYHGNDAIGDLIQCWVKDWFHANNIYFRQEQNTQVFPDFYLNEKEGYLEIKTFNLNATPAFDLAAYDAYLDSVLANPLKLDADYLIFGYVNRNGIISIEKVWLKKVWEIAGTGGKHPITIQRKRDKTIQNIRPFKWYSKTAQLKPFSSKIEFLSALQKTINTYGQGPNNKEHWKENVISKYQKVTGTKL